MSASLELDRDGLRLRPFRARDAARLAACFDDPDFVRFLSPEVFPLPFELRDADAYLAAALERDPEEGIDRAVELDGALVGCAHVFAVGSEGDWEIALLLADGAPGRGLGSRIAPLLIAHAFEARRARRVLATAHPDNLASRRVMEKSGMRLVEIRAGGRLDRDGRRVDQACYALEAP